MLSEKQKFISSQSIESTKTDNSSVTSLLDQPRELLNWDIEYLGKEHHRELTRCIYKQKDAKKHFDSLSVNYEGMYLRIGYPDPKKVADFVQLFVSKSNEKNSVKILDFACGTGLIGKYLKEYGFSQIDGMDLSTGMLDQAREKYAYQNLQEYTIGDPENFPAKWKNKFDVVTCAGLICNNYMDYKLFEEMLLATKKGGIIVFAARYSYVGEYWYDEIINLMEKEGRWEFLKSEAFFKYDKIEQSIGRFSKTPCKVFAFRKTQEELSTYKKKQIKVEDD